MTRPPATTATIGESLSGINHWTGRRAALLCLLLVIFAQSTLLRATDFERVRPAAFQGVTPGITTLKQLKAQFNDRLRKKNSQWYIDTGSPFRFVAVDVSENKVVSIHAELVTSRPLEKTTAELGLGLPIPPLSRSEERRVGKECRSRWPP